MKLKNWMITATAAALLVSCGNSESDKGNTTDSASVTNTTTMENKTTRTIEVPAATRTGFESKYPQAKAVIWTYYHETPPVIEWEWTGWPLLDNSDYVATFDMDGNEYWVWYDDSGEWVGTVEEVNTSGLPSAVDKTIKSQFAGYTIVSANKENDKNRTAYEVKMEKGSDKMKVLIAEDGTVMKKKGEVGGVDIKEKPVKDPQ